MLPLAMGADAYSRRGGPRSVLHLGCDLALAAEDSGDVGLPLCNHDNIDDGSQSYMGSCGHSVY